MLLEFAVENFRSIRDRAVLSLIGAPLKSEDGSVDDCNIFNAKPNLPLLRAAVMYGANASGKSNIIHAMSVMRRFVLNSARLQEGDAIPVTPFLLNTVTRTRPTEFEIVFLVEGVQYRYGYATTTEAVLKEWLYYVPNKSEKPLFTRDGNIFEIAPTFKEGKGREEFTLPNTLFLSRVSQLNPRAELTKRIIGWFQASCRVISGTHYEGTTADTLNFIEKGEHRERMVQLLAEFDMGITDLSIKREPVDVYTKSTFQYRVREAATFSSTKMPQENDPIQKSKLLTHHTIRDQQDIPVEEQEFEADDFESEGTRKMIALCAPFFETLARGNVLMVDELDSKMHPLITLQLVRLFQSPDTNPHNAQLVFATHDTNLLDRSLLRRDQIYFVEKDKHEGTRLYSLAAFKGVRNDASFEKNYLQGRYGAVPFIGDVKCLFMQNNEIPMDRAANFGE